MTFPLLHLKKLVSNIRRNDPNDNCRDLVNDQHDFAARIYLSYSFSCYSKPQEPNPRNKDSRSSECNFVDASVTKGAGADNPNGIHDRVWI